MDRSLGWRDSSISRTTSVCVEENGLVSFLCDCSEHFPDEFVGSVTNFVHDSKNKSHIGGLFKMCSLENDGRK